MGKQLTHEQRLANHIPEPNTGCWLWLGCVSDRGHGHIYTGIAKHGQAHRYYYENLVGQIPAGLELDHLCRVPSCVNPAHLEPVTRKENVRRGMSPSANCGRQTHCKQGHAFAGDNLVRRSDGARRCRACKNAGDLRRYYRLKEVLS